MINIEICVPEWNIDKIYKLQKKLQKRSERIGLEPLVFQIGEPYYASLINENKQERFWKEYPVEISGSIPVVEGWEPIAYIEHRHADGNIVKTFGDGQVPKRYRNCDPFCEHCETHKIKVHSYVIRHVDTDEYKMVGMGCINQYVNADMLNVFKYLDRVMKDVDQVANPDPEEMQYRQRWAEVSVRQALAVAACSVSKHGYIKSSLGRTSTRNDVNDEFFSIYREHFYPAEDVAEKAGLVDRCINYWLEQSPKNDFVHNVQVIFGEGHVASNNMGYLVGAIGSYMNHVEQESKKNSFNVVNEYLDAEIKDRLEIDVIYLGAYTFQSYYGWTNIHRFVDKDGHVMVWFSGNNVDAEHGDNLHIKATVKKFQEYKDKKQTVITRVNVM